MKLIMHLPKFSYVRLHSLEEASRLLKDYGSDACFVSGGTDLYPRMKYGLLNPRTVITLKDAPVKAPYVNDNGDIHIDAFMNLTDVADIPALRERYPLLVDAALSVASGQIRNMATLGGNICLENRCLYYNQSHTFQFVEPCFKRSGDRCYLIPGGKRCFAVFMADTVSALIALRSIVTVAKENNTRSCPIEELYSGDALRPLNLEHGEILTNVVIPVCKRRYGAAFVKFSLRGAVEFAALNMAVLIEIEEDGLTCADVRFVAGAVSTEPVRLMKAEAAMQGNQLSAGLFADVASVAASEINPLPHHGYSFIYLKKCLEVQTRRVLEAAFAAMK
jgi:CO/xanthine dehydrogenase FAD-binding subunit